MKLLDCFVFVFLLLSVSCYHFKKKTIKWEIPVVLAAVEVSFLL